LSVLGRLASEDRRCGDLDGFREFVAARSPALVRSAWLLTGNEAAAEDLVQAALVKTWLRWSTVQRRDDPDTYVRKVIVSLFLTWNRRRWTGEQPSGSLPDQATPRDELAAADTRLVVREALAELPRRQRAVIVLRFYEDLTEAQTATLMGTSVGTVKSQTAKALAALRGSPLFADVMESEAAHGQH
jgi:RNA polymerase sigma-70 factor (sigma-E family)